MTTKQEMCDNVRRFCSECMGAGKSLYIELPVQNPGDIEICTAKDCIWYDFRFGKDPYPNKRRSELGKKRGFNHGKERG